MPILTLLSSLAKPAIGYFQRRQEIRLTKHQARLQLQQAQVASQQGSIKDELVLFLVTSPMQFLIIGAFQDAIWGGIGFTEAGRQLANDFVILLSPSSVYSYIVSSIFLGIFGLRHINRQQIMKSIKAGTIPFQQPATSQEQPVESESPSVAEKGTPKRKRKPTKAQFKSYLR